MKGVLQPPQRAAADAATVEFPRRRLWLLFGLHAWVGLLVWFAPATYGAGVFLATTATTLCLLWLLRRNFVFQLRLVLLAVIGYYAAGIKLLSPEASFSPVGLEVQTYEIAVRMFAATALAVAGGGAGLLLGWNFRAPPLRRPPPPPEKLLKPKFGYAVLGVLVTGYLSAVSYGPTVFNAVYASGEGEGQLLGNLQVIGVVCLVVCFLAAQQGKWTRWLLAFLCMYFFIWGIFIRGGRMEVLSGAIALLVMAPAAEGKVFSLRPVHYVLILVGLAILEAWGNLRSLLAAGGGMQLDVLADLYGGLADEGIYHAGTISGINITLANILHMLEYDIVDLQYGSTYVDYILRTPPEFLYPNRPTDLAWLFLEYGYSAVGGFFELAEAYYNFGIAGCLVVPFVLSFLLATTYRRALDGRLLWIFLMAAVLAVFFRGAWYQTFAFYKGALTGLVLYFMYRTLPRLPRLSAAPPAHGAR